MEIRIREAVLEDVPEVAHVHVTSWQAAYHGLMPDEFIKQQTIERRTKLWTNVVSKRLANLLIAEENQKVVGFICFEKAQPNLPSQSIEISSIYLLPSHFGKGVGSKLMEECESKLASSSVSQVTLWALDTNKPALTFYKKHGFIETGKRSKERLSSVVLNDLELVKILE